MGLHLLLEDNSFYISASGGNNSEAKLIVTKINSKGQAYWNKLYDVAAYTAPMLKCSDGNILLAVSKENMGALIKLDTGGNVLWSRHFQKNYFITALKETPVHEIIVYGQLDDVNGYSPHPFIAKLDSSAQNVLKAYVFGTDPSKYFDWFFLGNFVYTKDKSIMIIGSRCFTTYLIKLDSNFNFIWSRQIGVTGGGFFDCKDLIEVSDGFLCSGIESQHVSIAKIDKQGNPVWNKTYRPHRTVNDIKLFIEDQKINLTAITWYDSASVPVQLLMMQTDMNGNVIKSTINKNLSFDFFPFDITPYGSKGEWVALTKLNPHSYEVYRMQQFGEMECLEDRPVTQISSPALITSEAYDYTVAKDTLISFTTSLIDRPLADSLMCGTDQMVAVTELHEISVPNIFTPNDDGINDLFFINGSLKSFSCKIFNRWGSSIFEFSGTKNGWSGKDCTDGVYFYVLEGTDSGGKDFSKKGSITLLR